MAETIQDLINAKIAEINGLKGDVPGFTPAECNRADINTQISDAEDELKNLRIQKVVDEAPWSGTGFILRFGNANIPNLTGTVKDVADLVLATGLRPPVVVISKPDVYDITVTATGTNITLTVAGETDPMEAGKQLADFVDDKGILVDVAPATIVKEGNEANAKKFQNIADLQQSIIDAMTAEEVVEP